jgi:hypothetical protein
MNLSWSDLALIFVDENGFIGGFHANLPKRHDFFVH